MLSAGPTHRLLRGMGLVELLVGLAVGAIVLAGALALAAQQGRQAGATQAEQIALREFEAVDRLLWRLLRQASATVAWPDAASLQALLHGTGLHFASRVSEGSVRRVGLRLSDGLLALSLEGGPWQALHDPQRLRIEAMDLSIAAVSVAPGDDEAAAAPGSVPSAGAAAVACPHPLPPRLRWRLQGRLPDDRAVSAPARVVQVRDLPAAGACPP